MEKYLNYIKQFHNNNQNEIDFINNQLNKHLQDNAENQTEIEHILDFLYSTRKSYKNIGYKTILEKANKWSEKLQSQTVLDEKEGVDYEVVLDFKDGFKFVKLLTKNAYNREGKLMSHCVASYYYKKSDNIYSLRDENNKPHCTVSDNSNQIKGKGNGSITPKYIKYVVEFLEFLGVSVRDSEMANLGYVNIENIQDENIVFPQKLIFKEKYYPKKDVKKITDKDGNPYQSISLWDSFGLIDNDMNVLFDTKQCIKAVKINMIHGNKVAMADNNKVAMTHDNKVAMTYSNRVAMTDNNEVAVTNSNEVAMTNSNKIKSKDYNNISVKKENDIITGSNSVVVAGNRSKVKGDIGTLIILWERDKNNKIIAHKSFIIDNKKYKKNIYYCLKDGEVVEWHADIFNN